jgi:AcrR family transcriptional regulator
VDVVTRPQPGEGRLHRSRDAVLREATAVLVADPRCSLGEIASAIGIGRTTLHRMFPTRHDLFAAVALDALDHLDEVYSGVGLSSADATGPDPLAVLRRWTSAMVPLGPRLLFLVRAGDLLDDEGLAHRILQLDQQLVEHVRDLQSARQLDPLLPPWWIVESLNALVYVAWEQVDSGRLAPREADRLVMRTWLDGVAASATATGRVHDDAT